MRQTENVFRPIHNRELKKGDSFQTPRRSFWNASENVEGKFGDKAVSYPNKYSVKNDFMFPHVTFLIFKLTQRKALSSGTARRY